MKQLLRIFILAVLSLFFAAPFSYAQSKAPAGSAESSSGQAVNLTAKAAVLIEGNSGEIILEKNKDTELVPASITKIMTLTLIMEALEEGKIQLTDSVSVSEYAASMGGSQVFLEPNETQTVDTMIKCISIASANDAAVAMAEKIAGSEQNFVKKMNEKAKELGMKHTQFKNCTGLDDDIKSGHFSSADSVQKRVSSSAPRQSSGQSFRPSARKRPSARRNAPLDARRQAYLTFAFSRLVIFSIRLSSNYQNIQKGRPRI